MKFYKWTTFLLLFVVSQNCFSLSTDHWFESFKATASDKQLYAFLYAMPKGGDLHNHLSGSGYAQWWFELATNSYKNGGYQYYTRISVKSCSDESIQDNHADFLFKTIQNSTYNNLSVCEKSTYQKLDQLTPTQKEAWLKGIQLDKPSEGRNEFFNYHWQRLNELTRNPFIMTQLLLKNMQAFGHEGLIYLETMLNPFAYKKPNGNEYTPEFILQMLQKMLNTPIAKKTGVTVRLQTAILRFLPDAEQRLIQAYIFAGQHPALYVGVNMVGIEDNPNGQALRFLPTLTSLRKTHPHVPLAIHAGEVDVTNFNVRDTLRLGATRIGHGLNILGDMPTVKLMKDQDLLIEINLISNLLLEYVEDYSEHPFPSLFELGVPLALSTDDRGMWDSNLTDEFFVAVKEFDLSWQQIVTLSKNSIRYSFIDPQSKQQLLNTLDQNLLRFTGQFLKNKPAYLSLKAIQTGRFICQRYQVCLKNKLN